MTYPNFEKDSSTCANCGNALFNDGEFTNQSYLTIRDNFMIVNFSSLKMEQTICFVMQIVLLVFFQRKKWKY